METVKILLVLCFILECCNCWINEFDGPLSYECLPGQELAQIVSRHNNYYEDRQWDFQCGNTGVLATSCKWTNRVNRYGKLINFKCASGGVIAGLRSYPNTKYQDRVFDVKCCSVKNPSRSCKWTKYANRYDGQLQYYIPPYKYINGIYSTYSGRHRDRRFRFRECYVPK
ncbi:hypothetical protein SNE40_000208 [Patella caerulea]|uniref:Dermatopontin n=1 Tax=Patella caerulea TaxID=87958 RepID=A0AAN8KG47_PATCE